MTAVFLDTVGIIAVWDTSDQWHAPAAAAYELLKQQGRQLLATTPVLLECGNAAARRPYRSRVKVLRQALLSEQLLIEPTPDDWAAAWDAFDRGEANQAGIVDHLSFAVMRRLEISEAFTNDQHFRAAGFTTLF